MARIIEYTFPACNTQDVCLLQTPLVGGNYILNGNLVNTIGSEVSFIDRGYSRNISITSTADVSAITYTITGFQNGVKIIEDVTGPDNTTVYGNEIYDTIISVTSNDAFDDAISIGTGPKGFFRIINIDLNNAQQGGNFLTLITKTAPPVSTTIYGTPIDLSKTGLTYPQILATNINNLFSIKAASAVDNYSTLPAPYKSILIQLNGGATTINSIMYMNFTQTTQYQS